MKINSGDLYCYHCGHIGGVQGFIDNYATISCDCHGIDLDKPEDYPEYVEEVEVVRTDLRKSLYYECVSCCSQLHTEKLYDYNKRQHLISKLAGI